MILYNRENWQYIPENSYMFQNNDWFANNLCNQNLFFAEENIAKLLMDRFGDSMLERNFIDIGANVGAYTLMLAPIFQTTYAFEPVTHTYNIMCGNVAINELSDNTVLINAALSDSERDMVMHYHDILGSLTHFSDTETDILTENVKKYGYLDFQSIVHVTTLDSYDIQNVGFIKMDVEGNELKVLKGAQKTLEQSDYPVLLLESAAVSDGDDEEFANYKISLRDELFSHLKNLNYIINETEDPSVFLCEHRKQIITI